jgi:hypothetical protein
VLRESATDCFTLHAPFLLARQVFLWAGLVTLSLHCFLEQGTLLGGDPAPPVPQLVGRRAGLALRPGGGFGLGSGFVVARPVAGMAGKGGMSFGARFQRADACFDGAIIPWRGVARTTNSRRRGDKKSLAGGFQGVCHLPPCVKKVARAWRWQRKRLLGIQLT